MALAKALDKPMEKALAKAQDNTLTSAFAKSGCISQNQGGAKEARKPRIVFTRMFQKVSTVWPLSRR
jgi:hypothetical protein